MSEEPRVEIYKNEVDSGGTSSRSGLDVSAYFI